MKRILLSILLIGILLMSACGAPTAEAPAPVPAPAPAETPSPAPEPVPTPPKQAEPQLIKEWSGTGIKTTEPFTINSKPWAISWANNPTLIGGESMGILQIMVYNIKNPDIPVTLAANTMEKGSDTSYIYETGTFYLTVNAANTQWTVQVWAIQ